MAPSQYRLHFRFLIMMVGCLSLLTATPFLRADELNLDAEALFARGVSDELVLTPKQDAIQLQRGVLFEDDGPAAGFSYLPNTEKLDPDVWIKKELIIPQPQAKEATLLVGRGGELTARINGKPVALDLIGKQGNYWQAYRFPPDALRSGKNEIVLSGTGSVWIARDDEYTTGSLTRQKHPNRSAKSLDQGKTWNDKALGTKNGIDGEYYVRVFLDQFQSEGRLTLGVIDAGNLSEKPIGPPLTQMGPIQINADVRTTTNSAVTIRARTGTTFVPDDKNWSEWSILAITNSQIERPRGRFLELEFLLATNDPQTSPAIESVTISATPKRPRDWTKEIDVSLLDNPQIVRSAIDFQYEPFDRPELAQLRCEHKLDQVVSGAKSEFELIQKLAAWSATRWDKMHLKDSYPPYNALEILKPHEDGTPIGGFCQQYNTVFLQACESFGLVGRLVSLGPGNMTEKIRGGHETVEIWSNEFRKWVYIDGNTAWYAVDQKTKTPLSLWELRPRQLAAFRGEDYPPIKVITLAKTSHTWEGLTSWPPFVELRLIPRSNVLEEESPMPLNQGMRGWFWTGHYVWADDIEPARMLYAHRVIKRANFEWTLNQAHVVFEATEPGIIRTHLDTKTPGFQQFVRLGNGTESSLSAIFNWKLLKGRNRLRIAPQNVTGRNGIAATVEFEWKE